MNKFVLILICSLLFGQVAMGQYTFRKGKNAINAGAGYKLAGEMFPSAHLAYERSLWSKRDFGHLGVGVSADALFKGDSISPVGTIRGAYHIALERNDLVDIYTGAGLVIAPLEEELFQPDLFFGARFKFHKRKPWALFVEGALYGANIRGGLCFIFKNKG